MLCTAHRKPVQLYNKRTCALLCLDCYFTPSDEQRCVSCPVFEFRPLFPHRECIITYTPATRHSNGKAIIVNAAIKFESHNSIHLNVCAW